MKTILIDAVYCFVREQDGRFIIFDEMYDLLEKYPNPKIILTGANDEQIREFGLDDMPYEVFTLKHDPEKSDPKYFERLLKQHGLDADDVIYVEHSAAAVKCAESVGIKTFHYDSERGDLAPLGRFLNENLHTERYSYADRLRQDHRA